MEWLYEQKVFTYTEQNILGHHYPSTLTNPKFKDFKIESGDVLLVRGKSYVHASGRGFRFSLVFFRE